MQISFLFLHGLSFHLTEISFSTKLMSTQVTIKSDNEKTYKNYHQTLLKHT